MPLNHSLASTCHVLVTVQQPAACRAAQRSAAQRSAALRSAAVRLCVEYGMPLTGCTVHPREASFDTKGWVIYLEIGRASLKTCGPRAAATAGPSLPLAPG
jgi:hypothetical protein